MIEMTGQIENDEDRKLARPEVLPVRLGDDHVISFGQRLLADGQGKLDILGAPERIRQRKPRHFALGDVNAEVREERHSAGGSARPAGALTADAVCAGFVLERRHVHTVDGEEPVKSNEAVNHRAGDESYAGRSCHRPGGGNPEHHKGEKRRPPCIDPSPRPRYRGGISQARPVDSAPPGEGRTECRRPGRRRPPLAHALPVAGRTGRELRKEPPG